MAQVDDVCETVSSINPDDSEFPKMSVQVTVLELESAEGRKESIFVAGDKTYHQGIYWRSPISMVTFFLLGVFMSVGHHLYYSSLVGQVVGNVNDQQTALRFVLILCNSLSLYRLFWEICGSGLITQ
jgi:hypothetical protein